MEGRTGDGLIGWFKQHRPLVGGLVGGLTALVLGVALVSFGWPWYAAALFAGSIGALAGMLVGSRRDAARDPMAMARSGAKHPYLWSFFGGFKLFAWGAGVLDLPLWVCGAVGAGMTLLLLPLLLWVVPRDIERHDQRAPRNW